MNFFNVVSVVKYNNFIITLIIDVLFTIMHTLPAPHTTNTHSM